MMEIQNENLRQKERPESEDVNAGWELRLGLKGGNSRRDLSVGTQDRSLRGIQGTSSR